MPAYREVWCVVRVGRVHLLVCLCASYVRRNTSVEGIFKAFERKDIV